MKTLFEWMPGERGALVAAVGTATLSRRTVTLDIGRDPGLYRQLYENDQLTGQALKDARKMLGDV